MREAERQRIEWIDLAKGICIIFVVFHHMTTNVGCGVYFSKIFSTFRMPLYFILSGLFFKQYEGFFGFLKRKLNKLMIPFLFFLMTTSVIPYWIYYHDNPFVFFFNGNNGPVFNFPIWFLLCLFEINILFYLIHTLVQFFMKQHQTVGIIVMTLICGGIGLAMAALKVRTPLYLGTTLTAIPFFAFGWCLRKHTSFLSSPVNLKLDISIIVAGLLFLCFFTVPVTYSYNSIPREGLATAHLCGIAGTMLILTLAKVIGRLPFVSFWGRYSIMILCSHQLVILILFNLLNRVMTDRRIMGLIIFALTLIICHFLIIFMKRYMPHVTAQKDVIRV